MPSQISYPKTQDEINISNLEQFYYQDLLNEFKTDLTYNQSLLDIENWVQSNYQ